MQLSTGLTFTGGFSLASPATVVIDYLVVAGGGGGGQDSAGGYTIHTFTSSGTYTA